LGWDSVNAELKLAGRDHAVDYETYYNTARIACPAISRHHQELHRHFVNAVAEVQSVDL
jgi:hypothetical protein